MPVTVRLPAALHASIGTEVQIDEPVHDIADVREALERHYPEQARELSDPKYSVAVNGVMLRHGVRQYPVKDGDVVEIVPSSAA